MNSLTSSLNLELEPIMGKIQILSALSRIEGLSGNVKLITTFEQLRLSQITFSRRQEGDKMTPINSASNLNLLNNSRGVETKNLNDLSFPVLILLSKAIICLFLYNKLPVISSFPL
jgi:hypothetical protein